MRLVAITSVLILAATTLTACGANCQEACDRAFADDKCGVTRAGITEKELIDDCMGECNKALKVAGEVRGPEHFDPNTPMGSVSVELQNEKEAALWMDCVVETSCPRLENRYCAGGGI